MVTILSEAHRSGEAREQAPSDLRRRGVPLAVRLTGANQNDSQEALALVDAIPPLHGERGRRGSGQTACSGIAATTLRRFVVGCGRAISSRGSLCVLLRTGVG